MNDKLREELAEYAHDAWSGWMKHMFRKCQHLPEYCYHAAIPPDLKERWTRQMETPYSELSDDEQESDRKEADEMLGIMRKHPVAIVKQYSKDDTKSALKTIVEQLRSCGYTCEGGPLEYNLAFVALVMLSGDEEVSDRNMERFKKWNKVIKALEALYEKCSDTLEEWKDVDMLIRAYDKWLE